MKSRKSRKSIDIPVRIWLGDKERIRIRFPGIEGKLSIVTVSDNESPKRGHPKLYACLRNILQSEGKWPSETTDN